MELILYLIIFKATILFFSSLFLFYNDKLFLNLFNNISNLFFIEHNLYKIDLLKLILKVSKFFALILSIIQFYNHCNSKKKEKKKYYDIIQDFKIYYSYAKY